MQYIEFRAGHFFLRFASKVMRMDYVQYENEDNQKIIDNASDKGLGGNGEGLEGLLHNLTKLMVGVLGLLLYGVLLSNVSIWIAVFLIVISAVQFVAFYFASRFEFHNTVEKGGYMVSQQYFKNQSYDVASGKDVRLYQLQHWLSREYRKVNEKYQHLIAKERFCYFASDLLGLFLQLLRDGITYLYFMNLLKHGMAVSEFVLYIGLIASFSVYFNEITTRLMHMERDQIGIEYLRKLMDIAPVFHHGTGEKLSPSESTYDIVFSHVSFSYPAKEGSESRQILNDISFTMKKGEKLALVGVNGAGKSTIIKLICGFYRPTSGTITINGIDVSDLDLEDYYQYLAVVFQDAFTSSFTIEENVTCKEPVEARDEKCVDAMKQAGIWEKIASLDQKERTYLNKDVSEEGIKLSGGQLQKLMLARALYKDCKVLLLDEPTAALDAIAESEMYEEYERLLKGRTALFISHRLASTRFCDRIIFIENGQVIEEGTHDSLMEFGGRYREMFEIQSKYYKDEEETEYEAVIS